MQVFGLEKTFESVFLKHAHVEQSQCTLPLKLTACRYLNICHTDASVIFSFLLISTFWLRQNVCLC